MDLIEIVKGMSNAGEAINENFKKLAIESEELEDGSWYRLPGGLQIVLFKKVLNNLPITQTAGSMYRSNQQTIYYPKAFKEGTRPSVAFELSGETLLSKGSPNSEPGHDGFATYIMRPISTTGDIVVNGIAMGSYK